MQEWEHQLEVMQKHSANIHGERRKVDRRLNQLKADLRQANKMSQRAVCIKGKGVC